MTQRVNLKTELAEFRGCRCLTAKLSHYHHALIGDYKRQELVINRRIFHQRSLRAKVLLKSCEVQGFNLIQ